MNSTKINGLGYFICWLTYRIFFSLEYIFIILAFTHFCTPSFADEQLFTGFKYDNAGNIVGISHIHQTAPPNVSNITPDHINSGETVRLKALGTNLYATQVTSNAPGIIISNIDATQTEVNFDIATSQGSVSGMTNLIFTTGLGSTSYPIAITEHISGLLTIPNPISISPNSKPNQIQVTFPSPRLSTETYSLSITDPETAELLSSTLTVPSGATNAIFQISGHNVGATTMNMALTEKFISFSFPVFVSEAFSGKGDFHSDAVGVYLETNKPDQPHILLSQDVGILNPRTEAVVNNPLLSQDIGVLNPRIEVVFNNPLLSQDIGVLIPRTEVNVDNPILSPAVVVNTGTIINRYSPTIITAGTQIDVLLSGENLDQITNILIEPADTITVDTFSINADSTMLTVSLTIDQTALPGNYRMIVNTVSSRLRLSDGNQLILTIP